MPKERDQRTQRTPPLVQCVVCRRWSSAEFMLWEASEHSTYTADGRPRDIAPTCSACFDEIRALDREALETGE